MCLKKSSVPLLGNIWVDFSIDYILYNQVLNSTVHDIEYLFMSRTLMYDYN